MLFRSFWSIDYSIPILHSSASKLMTRIFDFFFLTAIVYLFSTQLLLYNYLTHQLGVKLTFTESIFEISPKSTIFGFWQDLFRINTSFSSFAPLNISNVTYKVELVFVIQTKKKTILIGISRTDLKKNWKTDENPY